jgi:hypothetical protein
MTEVDVRAAPPQPAPAPDDRSDSPRRGRPRLRNEILRRGTLGGVDPAELAARFGTPCYIYDLDVVDRQVAALRAILPSQFELAYAVKANPSLAVVGHVGRLGLGADVASGGELALALRAGIPPGRIVFTGPGKREPELRAAVEADIRAVTVESRGELERLEAIAEAAGRRVPVLVRAGVGEAARLERVRLVGDDGAGKFGMDPRDLVAAARHAADSPWLELLGLHAFGASNVLDAPALADHVDMTVAAAEVMARDAGVPLRLVDVGGGLGIPYEAHDDDVAAGHDLAIDDRSDVGARRAEEEPTRLEEDPRLARPRVTRESGGQRREPRPEADQVESVVVGLVRDAEPATDVDKPERHAGVASHHFCRGDRHVDVIGEGRRVEDIRGTERVQAEQLEPRRIGRVARRRHEVTGIHAELAGAVVADEPDAFESRRLPYSGPNEHRHATIRRSRDRLEPLQLAARFDGDRANVGFDRGAQLRLALARPGEDDSPWRDARPEGECQLPTGGDVCPEPEPGQMANHGQ